jgi:hypothetical protein
MVIDVAETISLRTKIDYRATYEQVGRAVAEGRPLEPLDARAALATRTVTGGAAPAPMDAMLRDCEAAVAGVRAHVAAARSALRTAEDGLLELARRSALG